MDFEGKRMSRYEICDYCGKAEVEVKDSYFNSCMGNFTNSRTRLYLCPKCSKMRRKFQEETYLKYSKRYRSLKGEADNE